jgi:hypothetical protein
MMLFHGTPFVLLRHTLPDGGAHLDFLIRVPGVGDQGESPGAAADVGQDERVLRSFRLGLQCDVFAVDVFDAVQMPEHRAAYLTYEGPIGGGRGDVVRVASGMARVEVWSENEMKVILSATGKTARALTGVRVRGELWRFVGKSWEELGGVGRSQ